MHKKLWNRDFFLILQGSAVSALGDILYSVAIGYWVYEKTGSSALMGVMSSISMFMTMLVMPFSGAVIDKCDRKAVIVGMDGLRGILMLGVGALAFADRLHVAAVLGAAFLASACSVFFEPAVSTLMIDIIPHDDMVRGQSVQEGVSTAVGLVGKALSGALTAFFGVPVIIFLNGISYLFSAFTELFIRVPQTKHQGEKVTVKGVLGDFTAAVRTILRDRFLRLFGPCTLAINLLAAGPMMLMLPFTMEKGFTVEQYGYLMSAQTAASLICVCLLGVVKLPPQTSLLCHGHRFFGIPPVFHWGLSGDRLCCDLHFAVPGLLCLYAGQQYFQCRADAGAAGGKPGWYSWICWRGLYGRRRALFRRLRRAV